MNTNTKILTTLLMLVAVLAAPAAHAQDADYIQFDQIEINGDEAEDGDTLYVQRGEELDLRVSVEANDTIDVENAQIEAWIAGYRHVDVEREKVTAYTDTFDLPAGNTRDFDLNVEIPVDIDQKNAKLRIAVSDENSADIELYNYQLNIEGADEDSAVQVRDFVVSPSTSIQAGRAASFHVRVQNYGDRDIQDASLRVRIPELDLEVFESINELDQDETQSFESLLLRIPQDAEPGQYNVEATVEFDRFESTTTTQTLTVVETEENDTTPEQRTQVTAPDKVTVNAGGQTSVYPILIENRGSQSQTYTLNAQGVTGWGAASFDPGNVVIVEPGQSKTVYLRLTANQQASGDKTFTVNIDADGDSNSFTAVANIKNPQQGQQADDGDSTVRTILEWALVVLIVVLIVLGLVLLFRQGGNGDDETDEDEPDYY